MDYFDVVDELRLRIRPPPTEPGQPPKPTPNPGPEAQRTAWQTELRLRPVPNGAVAWVERLKPTFAARKVPPALAWLAEVESSFDPAARSPAGAAGLFQLMPRTAQSMGLSLHPRDERLDPDKNAAAAAGYLRQLHGQFKDWRLALAAYNAGEGNLRMLMDRYKTRAYDQVATRLPAETQMYVPKFEAVLQKREGLKLNELPAPAP
ncbi:MAG TPA: lytic transglycosylase domain-containing protein [Candidatus Acidoferrum sp.]|nr:lytic transglycosylase domain-containing protein [Candidatus Acidoferrum sp.]